MTDQRTNDRLLERTRTLGLTSSASACMQLEQTYLQLHLATPAHSWLVQAWGVAAPPFYP